MARPNTSRMELEMESAISRIVIMMRHEDGEQTTEQHDRMMKAFGDEMRRIGGVEMLGWCGCGACQDLEIAPELTEEEAAENFAVRLKP